MREVHTLKALIDEAAICYGERIVCRYKERKEIIEKSYLQLKEDSDAWSRTLEHLEIAGKHVAVIGPTSYHYLVTYFGTVGSGSVIVPLDKELPIEELMDLLDRADISVLVYDNAYEELALKVKEKCKSVEYLVVMQAAHTSITHLCLEKCLEENKGSYEKQILPETLSSILFTSGTTGKSKGVMLSHKNLMHNITCVDMGIRLDDVLLSVLPIHHAYCFSCDFLIAIHNGITVCISDSMRHLSQNLLLFKPTALLVVPMIAGSMLYQLEQSAKNMQGVSKVAIAQHALGGRLRLIYCGGAYLDPSLIAGFRAYGINLIQGYGMTECAPRIANNFEWEYKETSVGKILPGTTIKIVEGEVWVKSDSVMMGYYKNPEATEETIQKGWLKTGDLGYVDEDNFLYITGRKKNLIILSNGENISAEELENKLMHEPIQGEVLVYEEDNKIVAEIFPNLEYAKEAGIVNVREEIQGIVSKLNDCMPLYKQIQIIRIRESEFEKTTSRKIKRRYSQVK